MSYPPVDDDDDRWLHWREQWRLREGTVYLNHGSFGPPPEPVRAARHQWQRRLDEQPMDFFVREFEPAWHEARRRLAAFVGTNDDDLIFVENATAGMNIIAESFSRSLHIGDEVLLTDHEYGAVRRIWQRACGEAGLGEPKIVKLPLPIESVEQVVDCLMTAAGVRTRLIVVSHITSPTAVILPVQEICRAARERGIAVCIDGPHAPAQTDVNIDALDCDFYTASCHKWLSAPFGSGFLYVHPRHQSSVRPPLLSWGRLLPNRPQSWSDEFVWSGTRDSSPYFTIPAAIDFLESVGLEAFRARTHFLARYARQQLVELTGREPIVPDSETWYGSMAHVPLPPGDRQSLQDALWQRYGIEVPIVEWNDGRYIRVSCHLYNRRQEIDLLVRALTELLGRKDK
jgi:isopenicillin-N epimerase